MAMNYYFFPKFYVLTVLVVLKILHHRDVPDWFTHKNDVLVICDYTLTAFVRMTWFLSSYRSNFK